MPETTLSSPLEETVVIVGVGLIGGSLAAAVKNRKLARRVIGVGRNSSRIQAARDAGLIDEWATDVGAVVEQADLMVFCTPVDQVSLGVQLAVRSWCAAQANSPSDRDLLLTDAGSVKQPICSDLAGIRNFVGSHPIAGSHRQGFEAADPNLFEGRTCVLTPLATASETHIQRLERFWQAVGMKTIRTSPAAHDEALAMTSHLPHVVAAALAATLSEQNRSLTGSGFRDTTRIAAGDADLWTGILMSNSEQIIKGIDDVMRNLTAFRQALSTSNSTAIRELLVQGQLSRTALDEIHRHVD